MSGRRSLVFGVALLAVGACRVLDQRVARGPCTLVAQTVDDQSVMQVLEPPYHTALRAPRLLQDLGERDISFSGQGWGRTLVKIDGPSGSHSELVEGQDINGGFRGWILEEVGPWHIRLASGSCLHEFTVDVAPAPP